MLETCICCGMAAGHEQRVSLWRNETQAVVEYQCSNCLVVFARIKKREPPPSSYPWSPYDNHRRRSIVRVSSSEDPITANRRRVTAGVGDIQGKTHNVRDNEEFVIEETNLEIGENRE